MITRRRNLVLAIVSIFVFTLAFCISLLSPTKAYATTNDDAITVIANDQNNDDVILVNRFQASYTLYGSYTTVATSTTGFNRNIRISCNNINVFHHNDVRMLDRNGNVIWEEYGAVAYNGSRRFWCGSNVYQVQVRVALQNVLGAATPLRAECTVSW